VAVEPAAFVAASFAVVEVGIAPLVASVPAAVAALVAVVADAVAVAAPQQLVQYCPCHSSAAVAAAWHSYSE